MSDTENDPFDTPRTDAAAFVAGNFSGKHAVVTVDFAEQLERELNNLYVLLRVANQNSAASDSKVISLKRELNETKSALTGHTVSCSNCNALAAENAAMREVINELYPQMQKLIDNGHHDLCKLLNYANAECDCGVQPATVTLFKLQPYLK